MTKYLESSFSVGLGSPEFRNGWEAIFGARKRVKEALTGSASEVLSTLLGGYSGSDEHLSNYLSQTYTQDDLISVYQYMLASGKSLPEGDERDHIVRDLIQVGYALTVESADKVNGNA